MVEISSPADDDLGMIHAPIVHQEIKPSPFTTSLEDLGMQSSELLRAMSGAVFPCP
ncbi:hypothetical protein ABT061_20825 [Streptosporangium sp. NPDC002544]|uniref:hypothetical protein n=1 Tax=Streptosporangium sp. NPDC002544 TaxID=3154538 RepID=UPI003333993A